MDVIEDYAWSSLNDKRNNNKLLPRNMRGLIVGKSGCGKTTVLLNLLLQDDWLDYDTLYVSGKSLHQPEYQIIKKGFESGFSKQQVGNIFLNQSLLKDINLSVFEVIDRYDGFRDKSVEAKFYDDCMMIPDPMELAINKNNLQ